MKRKALRSCKKEDVQVVVQISGIGALELQRIAEIADESP